MKIFYDMNEKAEVGEEDYHLNWLQDMGLLETCFLSELLYIEEGRIGCEYTGPHIEDDWCYDIQEWIEETEYIRQITKRHKFRKKYATI